MKKAKSAKKVYVAPKAAKIRRQAVAAGHKV
ncbi:MAG: hypothetical protein UY48_C0007G0021 [Candidatus Gottesmanbacteria bacterium GW2011_GWB1_49_7]|uniref:Uncharacterized protein n=1 Tax=Candidatus Gottesmanbacteria bacterium GW2011_GWB1_49_7 TaxID=1618448 RepID=A0A0G1YD73_9BACT|nr:MAG: hypothetical protein UY48_C0007G0021 [Candidatus Gottesmanbacteria bacterium GW2011_GWB1_49_7]